MPAFTLARQSPPAVADQVNLFHNLGQYMKSGIPLVTGLAHAQEQSSSAMRPMLTAIQHALEVRHVSLADAFRDHYPGGDDFLIAVLEQGEVTGTLEQSFRQLEQVAKRRQEQGRALVRAAAYPALCIVVFLVVWPIPNLVTEGVDAYLIRAIPPLVAIAVALWAWWTIWPRVQVDPPLARRIDGTMLTFPFIGKHVRAGVMARFGRALSLLVRTGLPLDRALGLAGKASGSPTLELRLKVVAAEVRTGRPLAELLAPLTDLLAPSFIGMVRTGETTGELDTMLEKAAELYEGEAKQAQDLALMMAGPALNIVVLVLIGLFVVHSWQGYLDKLGSIR